jgi:DNA-binding NtrC family response regulator
VPRLVVIEDEPGIGKVVFRALSSARFQIDCAAGRGGLEMARSGHHDLVLVDLMRSGLDGVGSAGLTVKVGRRTPWGTFHADGEGHERVDRGPGHRQADREVARS